MLNIKFIIDLAAAVLSDRSTEALVGLSTSIVGALYSVRVLDDVINNNLATGE